MSDGGYDPCECIFNHEMAMRRLLSLLRNNQGSCTDNECFQDGLPNSLQGVNPSDTGSSMVMIMMMWMVMAVVLYLLRPSSMRPRAGDRKDSSPGNDDGNNERRDQDPPAVM
eukprot:TRINITY_DN9252_c0_g1_i9.p1 TRINITY_DN9252_c0_g1~~TRINITY_DN9252_c0_g1_i9.p1  ORF type:complete len:112 (-),score=31.87 TRINITY_DN9252_c0_g1_i9:301-636(-)